MTQSFAGNLFSRLVLLTARPALPVLYLQGQHVDPAGYVGTRAEGLCCLEATSRVGSLQGALHSIEMEVFRESFGLGFACVGGGEGLI